MKSGFKLIWDSMMHLFNSIWTQCSMLRIPKSCIDVFQTIDAWFFLKLSSVYSSFSLFGCPKPVFHSMVFTGKYQGKKEVPSKTHQPCLWGMLDLQINEYSRISLNPDWRHLWFITCILLLLLHALPGCCPLRTFAFICASCKASVQTPVWLLDRGEGY